MSKKDEQLVGRASPLTLVWPSVLYDKLIAGARAAAPAEMVVLGELTNLPNSRVHLDNLIVLDQNVDGGSAECVERAMAQLLTTHEHTEKLWFIGHSHVNMGTFWSTQDERTMRNVLQSTRKLVNVVVCVDGSYKARLDFDYSTFFDKFEKFTADDPAFFHLDGFFRSLPRRYHWDLPVEFESAVPKEELEAFVAEVLEKTSRRSGRKSVPLVGSIRMNKVTWEFSAPSAEDFVSVQPMAPLFDPSLFEGPGWDRNCVKCEYATVTLEGAGTIVGQCVQPEALEQRLIPGVPCGHFIPRGKPLQESVAALVGMPGKRICANCGSYSISLHVCTAADGIPMKPEDSCPVWEESVDVEPVIELSTRDLTPEDEAAILENYEAERNMKDVSAGEE